MAISVIIPSYKNPDYLDLCLKSAFENQQDENEIIVVLDGYAELSQHVIEKYPRLNVLALEENMGQTYAHNTGVINASNECILIVNDDNVFPPDWDMKLNSEYDPNTVITPNQVEPNPSIFKNFIHRDFGKTPQTFNYEEYKRWVSDWDVPFEGHPALTKDGQTWPVFMNKKWYMAIGGIDPGFPSPAVADWDFFVRLELIGLKFVRDTTCTFYHFAGAATKTADNVHKHLEGERQSFEYFEWKWGYQPATDPFTHSRFPHNNVRGVNFRSR